MRNLEIGTQSQDSENAQRNLEIAQIPRLRRTYPLIHFALIMTPLLLECTLLSSVEVLG